ncbi:unnamed protein product [Cladocopium goreaui]|nr:unnamed protein product [Cladocopium goreaui]
MKQAISCLSAVADCVISAPSYGKVWHFFCASAALSSSSFFTAAFSRKCWLEGKLRCCQLQEDAETWFHALCRLHGFKPKELPKFCSQETPEVHLNLRLLGLYQKYLMPELEQEMLEKCRQDDWISLALEDEGEILPIFQQLQLLGLLQDLLGSWCSSQPQLMAGPLQWWLRSTRDVRVVESPEVSDLVVSDIFLKQSEDMLLLLAELNLLDVLEHCDSWCWLEEKHVNQLFTEDSLMPLTQLTSLRQELRSARFCQPAVALLLQPFPRLRADLLDAWFDRAGAWSPEALAQWAAAPGAMPKALLTQQWQSLAEADFQRFLSLAPLEQHDLSEELRQHFLLCWRQARSLPCAAEAGQMYRLWTCRMVTFHQLILWLLSLLCRPWGCPKRLAQSVQLMKRKGQMEILKSVMSGLLNEMGYLFEAFKALVALQAFILKVLWHILSREIEQSTAAFGATNTLRWSSEAFMQVLANAPRHGLRGEKVLTFSFFFAR